MKRYENIINEIDRYNNDLLSDIEKILELVEELQENLEKSKDLKEENIKESLKKSNLSYDMYRRLNYLLKERKVYIEHEEDINNIARKYKKISKDKETAEIIRRILIGKTQSTLNTIRPKYVKADLEQTLKLEPKNKKN